MTDAELAIRIEEASRIKKAQEEAKLAAVYEYKEPLEIVRRCIVTSKKYTITVEKSGWNEYTSGDSLKPLVDCLSMLTEEQHRLLILSISDAGFEQMFGKTPNEFEYDDAFD